MLEPERGRGREKQRASSAHGRGKLQAAPRRPAAALRPLVLVLAARLSRAKASARSGFQRFAAKVQRDTSSFVRLKACPHQTRAVLGLGKTQRVSSGRGVGWAGGARCPAGEPGYNAIPEAPPPRVRRHLPLPGLSSLPKARGVTVLYTEIEELTLSIV